ncbi:hypothetical protein LguiA_019353 [Lonicera macranthoides]
MKNKGKGKSKKSGKGYKQPGSKSSYPSSNVINTDMSIWGEKNEEVLEKKLRVKVENLFEDVLNELVSIGYENEVACNAIVLNGHVFHGTDLFNNIKNNAIAFIEEGRTDQGCRVSEHIPTTWEERISDLQELLMILAQKNRPNWTKSDAMKFLIATHLRVDPPKSTDFSSSQEKISSTPRVPSQFAQDPRVEHKISQMPENQNDSWNSANRECGSSSDTSNGNGYRSTTDSSQNVDLLKRVNLTPALEAHLEENVSKLVVAFQREMEELNSPCLLDSLRTDELKRTCDWEDEEDKLYLSLQKNHSIMSTVSYIQELREQLNKQKEWANKKFVQVAQRLGYTLVELKILKLERFVRESKTFKDKQRLRDDFLDKQIYEKDDKLKKVSVQLGRVYEHMRKVELTNSTYRANSEASKLNFTEYKLKELEFEKIEKKHLKRAIALEKQCLELEEQLMEDKGKEIEMKEEVIQVKNAIQEHQEDSFIAFQLETLILLIRSKLKEELKQKELTDARVLEENNLNKIVEIETKRNQAMLHRKLEIDFQLIKDDKRRMEEELYNLKSSCDSSCLLFEGLSQTYAFYINIFTGAMPLESFSSLQDSSPKDDFGGRRCVVCSKSEAFVLFLPCAHQVTCLNCNKMSNFGGTTRLCKGTEVRTRIPNVQVSTTLDFLFNVW